MISGAAPSSCRPLRSGLEAGDVLLALDGAMLEGLDDLNPRLSRDAIGRAAKLSILRDGARTSLAVRPEEAPRA